MNRDNLAVIADFAEEAGFDVSDLRRLIGFSECWAVIVPAVGVGDPLILGTTLDRGEAEKWMTENQSTWPTIKIKSIPFLRQLELFSGTVVNNFKEMIFAPANGYMVTKDSPQDS